MTVLLNIWENTYCDHLNLLLSWVHILNFFHHFQVIKICHPSSLSSHLQLANASLPDEAWQEKSTMTLQNPLFWIQASQLWNDSNLMLPFHFTKFCLLFCFFSLVGFVYLFFNLPTNDHDWSYFLHRLSNITNISARTTPYACLVLISCIQGFFYSTKNKQ